MKSLERAPIIDQESHSTKNPKKSEQIQPLFTKADIENIRTLKMKAEESKIVDLKKARNELSILYSQNGSKTAKIPETKGKILNFPNAQDPAMADTQEIETPLFDKKFVEKVRRQDSTEKMEIPLPEKSQEGNENEKLNDTEKLEDLFFQNSQEERGAETEAEVIQTEFDSQSKNVFFNQSALETRELFGATYEERMKNPKYLQALQELEKEFVKNNKKMPNIRNIQLQADFDALNGETLQEVNNQLVNYQNIPTSQKMQDQKFITAIRQKRELVERDLIMNLDQTLEEMPQNEHEFDPQNYVFRQIDDDCKQLEQIAAENNMVFNNSAYLKQFNEPDPSIVKVEKAFLREQKRLKKQTITDKLKFWEK